MSNKTQEETATFSSVDKTQTHAEWKTPDAKDYLLHTSIFTKCLEETDV